MVSDLVSLLLEAIKEVEQIARECGDADDRRWKWDLHAETVWTESGDYVACGPWDCNVSGNYALHMVTNDPNVILRRCQADRELVEKYREIQAESDRVIGRGYAEPDEMVSERLAFEWVIKNRAASYGLSVEEETTHE